MVGVILWLAKRTQQNENMQNKLDTELKILEAKLEAQAQSSRENHEALRTSMGQVLSRLDSIDRYLRSGKNE